MNYNLSIYTENSLNNYVNPQKFYSITLRRNITMNTYTFSI